MLHTLLFAALLSLSAESQVSLDSQKDPTPGAVQATGRNPYRNLFKLGLGTEIRRTVPSGVKTLPSAPAAPQSGCTMVIIPADPTIDRQIVVPVPGQADRHYTLRVFPAPCVATPGVQR
jgi:hypothetical protein